MNTEDWERKLPRDGIKYGYRLRDYRSMRGKLRWSWAVRYERSNENEVVSDYGYSFSRIAAIFSARIALIKAAAGVGARHGK